MSAVDKEESFYYKIKYFIHLITKAFLIAVFSFLGLVLVLSVVYFGDLYINNRTGNFKNPLFNAYVIVSPSMVPTIEVNDLVFTKRKDNNKYFIGDIITFLSSDIKYSGLPITHRIVEKKKVTEKKYLYATKGDNNFSKDPFLVGTADIYGKVIFKVPKFGYVQNFLSTPSNFFLCILVPTFLVIVYDLFRIFKRLSLRSKEMI